MYLRHRLSKSKILSGLQCHKRLWLEQHRRELIQHSANTLEKFRQGHAFGERARNLMGSGKLVGHTRDISMALLDTKAALAHARENNSRVFEAAFCHDEVVARADALEPLDDGWHMIEVKAAPEIEPYFFHDCAIQAWVADGAGYLVKKVTLAHIDASQASVEHAALHAPLKLVDVTAMVNAIKPSVEGLVQEFKAILAGEPPAVEPGPQCSDPFECPFSAYCRGAASRPRS